MAEALRISAAIATLLGLLGLIATLSYYFYARRLRYEEKRLEALPAEERARATDERLTRYGIDAKNLTREAKNSLILTEMERRYQFARLCLFVSATVFVACFALASAVFVVAMEQSPAELQELKMELARRKAHDEVVLTILAAFDARHPTKDEIAQLTQVLQEENERRVEEAFTTKLNDLAIEPETQEIIGELERLDRDIKSQGETIASADPSSLDVETMKLKRLVDKRNQQQDMLRQIIDSYNATAKGIIDSIGR